MSGRGAYRAATCPRARVIVEILEAVLDLMYPGYFGRRDLNSENLGAHTAQCTGGARTEDSSARWSIACATGASAMARPAEFGECAPRAHELTRDLSAAAAGDSQSPRCATCRRPSTAIRRRPNLDEVILAYPGRAGGQRVSRRSRAVRSRRADDGAHHDRVGAFEDRLRHSSGRDASVRRFSSITRPVWSSARPPTSAPA